MDVAAWSTVFAVASLISAVVGVGALVAAVRGRGRRRAVPRSWARLGLIGATAIATVATTGSLYYSERAGFVPCELCWYQRIAMYPLVVVLGAAVVQRRARAALAAIPLAGIGLVIAVYHYRLQIAGESGTGCDVSAPCNVKWVDEFGFVSIPFMAGCGFLGVLGLTLLALRADRVRSSS